MMNNAQRVTLLNAQDATLDFFGQEPLVNHVLLITHNVFNAQLLHALHATAHILSAQQNFV